MPQDLGESFARVWSLIDTPRSACPDVQLGDVLDALILTLLEAESEGGTSNTVEDRARAYQRITGKPYRDPEPW